MLIDPYFKKEAFVLFQSSNNWDKKIQDLKPDEIKNCIIYSTKGQTGGVNENIRILLQYHDEIEYIFMNDGNEIDQDTEEENEENMDNFSAGTDQEEVDELEEEKRN